MTTRAKRRTVEACVLGWSATGATKAEARKAAMAKIEAAAAGYWTPVVRRYRGYVGVLWREPEYYCYTVRRADEDDGDRLLSLPTCYAGYSRDTATRGMLRHLAQNGWRPGEVEAPAWLTDAGDRQDHAYWARWQNAYAAHKAACPGATDDDCRLAAGRASYNAA